VINDLIGKEWDEGENIGALNCLVGVLQSLSRPIEMLSNCVSERVNSSMQWVEIENSQSTKNVKMMDLESYVSLIYVEETRIRRHLYNASTQQNVDFKIASTLMNCVNFIVELAPYNEEFLLLCSAEDKSNHFFGFANVEHDEISDFGSIHLSDFVEFNLTEESTRIASSVNRGIVSLFQTSGKKIFVLGVE
jgi:hypothetical protein